VKNLLVEYKGGGFDGCFWQWNYFLWDMDGKFHNLLSTGYKGIKDEAAALQMLADYNDLRDKPNFLNLNRPLSVTRFVDSGNASLMSFLAGKHWQLGEQLTGHCQECGNLHDVVDMSPGDYSGDGGISISGKNLYCENCSISDEEW
jgi:hypothetical protein